MVFWNFFPSQGVHLHDVHGLDIYQKLPMPENTFWKGSKTKEISGVLICSASEWLLTTFIQIQCQVIQEIKKKLEQHVNQEKNAGNVFKPSFARAS